MASQHLTLVGSPSFASAASGFGQCLSLNGSSQYATIPVGALSFSTGASFSAVARVKTTTGAGLLAVLSRASSAGTAIFLGLNSGVPIGQVNGFNGNSSFSGGANLADGAWHTLALVVTGSTATLYADGVSVASGSGSYTDIVGGTLACDIGVYSAAANDHFWPGQIDEVALYSAALSGAGTINPSAPLANSAAGLIALYHLDSGNASGATVLDCAGAAVTLSPTTVPAGSGTALSFSGVNTAWTTVAPAFSVSGGSGASMGSTTVTGAGAATATLASGAAAGTLLVTDASSGATQTVVVVPAAVLYTVRGPARGRAYLESTVFTVQMAAGASAALTPGDGGGGGLFRPTSVTPASGGSATFTYQPAAPGVYTLSVANAGGLAAPPGLTFEAGALGPFRQTMEGGLPA